MVHAAVVGDFGEVVRVARECTEAPQWSDAAWRVLLAESVEGVGLRCVLVAEADGAVIGFAATGGAGAIAELENVAVEAAHRGQGLGAALCRAAMECAAQRGAAAMELEVRASNTAARRMYARLGFVEQGVRKNYYRDPVEDAVLMTTTLTLKV